MIKDTHITQEQYALVNGIFCESYTKPGGDYRLKPQTYPVSLCISSVKVGCPHSDEADIFSQTPANMIISKTRPSVFIVRP